MNKITVTDRPRTVGSQRFLALFSRGVGKVPLGARGETEVAALRNLVGLISRQGTDSELLSVVGRSHTG